MLIPNTIGSGSIPSPENMDIDLLADNVQLLSRLVHDFPQIKEIDLNPIKGTETDLFAVDARIIIL